MRIEGLHPQATGPVNITQTGKTIETTSSQQKDLTEALSLLKTTLESNAPNQS